MGSDKLTIAKIAIAYDDVEAYNYLKEIGATAMRVQYAKYDEKQAELSNDFGYEFACKLFGQATVDQMPRFVKGPKKGKLKGFVGWRNCTVGGWSKAHGGVIYPGKCVRAWLTELYMGGDNSAIYLDWCGRREQINFDRCYLYDTGREARARENERHVQSSIAEINNAIDTYWEKIRLYNCVIAVIITQKDMNNPAIEFLAEERAKCERGIASLENSLHTYGVQV